MVEHDPVDSTTPIYYTATKVIVQDSCTGQMAYAYVPGGLVCNANDVNFEELDLHPINLNQLYPAFDASANLTIAFNATGAVSDLNRTSSTHLIKSPSLLSVGENTRVPEELAESLLREALVYEILAQHPHPNIAKYFGCVVKDSRIVGLCLQKYEMDLREWIRSSSAEKVSRQKEQVAAGLRSGLEHLHALGLVHNDFHPGNIMMTDNDVPVIVDFGACCVKGVEVHGRHPGFPNCCLVSDPENDFCNLEKIAKMMREI